MNQSPFSFLLMNPLTLGFKQRKPLLEGYRYCFSREGEDFDKQAKKSQCQCTLARETEIN